MLKAIYYRVNQWKVTHEHLYLGILALIVGVLAGYGALVLRLGIEGVATLWTGEAAWSSALHTIPWYIFLAAPVCGGLIVGLINYYWVPKGEARVIPGVLEALSERGGRISGRKTFAELASNIVSVGSGASMGREAPTVALGAALASQLGIFFGLNEKQMRTIVGCGVAAGIAAAFNAPIAGVLFALEVILTDYAIATFTPIVLSAVIATVITRAHLGDNTMFSIPEFTLISSWEIPAYMALGVFCGLIAAVVLKMLPKSRYLFEKHITNPVFRPAVAGFILGCCALVVPEVMSIGYGTVESILLESFSPVIQGVVLPALLFLGVLLVFKAAVSVVCSGAGFGGGMIGPSLFIGVVAGAFFGLIVHSIFPGMSESYGAYALVACAAMMAAMLQAPMSSILMVFELSGNYQVMIPLMAACVIAALVKRAFGEGSAVTEALEERGIETGWGLERSWMRSVPVSRIPWKAVPKISEHARLAELKAVYVKSGKGCVQVVDDDDLMVGIITFADLQEWLLDSTLDQVVVASEIANRKVLTISENDNLLNAVTLLDRVEFEQMPVVAADNPRKVLGILSRNAVFSKYHKLIVKHGEKVDDNTHV
ncbi:MAG: chloride channel protein [Mariprofundaceae bacterium]|nr:chloride channel protein [Mariprofundaceae bacterium]